MSDELIANLGATWKSLGGTLISTPAVTSWGKDRLDIFGIGTNGRLYHKWWNGSQWMGWENLGGTCIHRPAAVSWGENHLDVFAIGIDQQIYHKWWDGAQWIGWECLGGNCVYGIAATTWGEGRIDLFSIDGDNVLRHKPFVDASWQDWRPLVTVKSDAANQSDWSPSLYAPAAIAIKPNLMSVFTIALNGQIYHAWGDGETWTGWQSVNVRPAWKAIHGIAATCRDSDRIDLFTMISDSTLPNFFLCQRSTTVTSGYSWETWNPLSSDSCVDAPAAIAWQDGQIDTFLIGSQRALYQKSWVQPNQELTNPVLPIPLTLITQVVDSNTPTIQGTAILGSNETLVVEISSDRYTQNDANLVIGTDNIWTLKIPPEHALLDKTYSIILSIVDTVENKIKVSIPGELTVNAPPLSIISQVADTLTPTIRGIFNSNDPTLDGAFLVVEVSGDNYHLSNSSIPIESNGIWTMIIPPEQPLSNGVYTITASAMGMAAEIRDQVTSQLTVQAAPVIPTQPNTNTEKPSPNIAPYKTIQFIGYSVKGLANFKKMADNQLYPLSLPDYIPQSLNVSFEAAARDVWQTQCTRIKQAIETAYSLQEARNDDSTCLKIFVVPEFYFHLALIVNSKISYFLHPYALDIITQLRIIVQDKKYENWLFIFGSILTLGQPVSSWRSLTFLNTTLFQQGGVNPEKDQARVAINGMFVDLTDSNRSRLYTVTPLKALRTADVAAMFKDKPRQQVEDDQSWYWDDLKFTALKAKDIFKLSGVTFGLNCSLDETFAEGAQVQIVFSSGSEKFDSVNPSQNGQFFVIDGSSTPGSKFISANQSLEAIKTLTLEHPAQNRYLAIKEPGQLQIYAPQELDSSTNETNST